MLHRGQPTFAVLAVLAVSGALAGCGASGAGAPAAGAPAAGRALFAQDCSACHSLTGAESPRRQGGDLLGVHLSRVVMLQFTREMPVRRRLDSADLKAIADYVLGVERRGR